MPPVQSMVDALMALEGAMYVMLVDSNNGKLLASSSGSALPLTVLAEKSAAIVRAERYAMQTLGKPEENAQEMLFTMKEYLHVIVMLPDDSSLYICAGVHRKDGNLAMMRRVAQQWAAKLAVTF